MQIWHRDATIWLAAHHTVLVSLFREPATLASMEILDETERWFAKRHRRFTIINCVAEMTFSRPEDGLREKAAEMMKEYSPHLIGSAVVIGGSGFVPSFVRSIVAGAMLLSRSPVPTKTFGDFHTTARWIAELPDQTPEVRDGVDELSRELDTLLSHAEVSL